MQNVWLCIRGARYEGEAVVKAVDSWEKARTWLEARFSEAEESEWDDERVRDSFTYKWSRYCRIHEIEVE